MAHNSPAPELLDLADRMGWKKKGDFDYRLRWNTNWVNISLPTTATYQFGLVSFQRAQNI